MKLKIKPKPKINFKETLESKSLVIKELPTKVELEAEIEDVTFKGQITADLNYQSDKSAKDRVSSANFSFTKKF